MKALFFLLLAFLVLAFAGIITFGIIGTWTGDSRWGGTSFIFVFAALVVGAVTAGVGFRAFEDRR